MTPAIKAAKQAGIEFSVLQYQHNPANNNYGLEAAEALNLNPAEVFKTLLVSLNGTPNQLAVALVPVNKQLNLKKVAQALKVKKVEMACPQIAQRTTGYLVGGISPLGQKKRLPTLIDASAEGLTKMNVNAGKRGLEIQLSPQDLAKLTLAKFVEIAL